MKTVFKLGICLCAVMMLSPLAGCGEDETTDQNGGNGSTDATVNTNAITTVADAGTMAGTWTNTTFGSSGAISVQVSFNPDTKVITVTHDAGGNVFGVSDPDPETFTIDATDFINNGTDTFNASSTTYGDASVTVTFASDGTGTFEITATNISTPGIHSVEASGNFSISGSNITFGTDGQFTIYSAPGVIFAQGTATAS